MSLLWDIEQFLQDENVFENGLNGRPAHMDSYMTVIDFGKLKAAVAKAPFSKDELFAACKEWEASSYLSPIHKLLSIYVKKMVDN